MKNFYEIYRKNNYSLWITTNGAGSVGKSYEIDNENRTRLLNEIGLDPSRVIFVKQKHSRKVVCAEQYRREELLEADGIITANKKDIIAVTVADCMPIFLYDRTNDVRALLHSGWKGTGIAIEAVRVMIDGYKSDISNISAYLGPSIRACCYKVDEERAIGFKKEWGESSVIFKNGEWYLSLDEANKNMLKKIGIIDIKSSNDCTCCNEAYGSFRRDGIEAYNQMMVVSCNDLNQP